MAFDTPITDLAQIAGAASAGRIQRMAEQFRAPIANENIKRLAEDFEAVFISQMMAPMFKGLETDELFGGGTGEDIFRSILIEEYGKSIARAGGIGLSDAIQRNIIKLQEARE